MISEYSAGAFALETFDFIVVGGGTSGIVVATRLAQNPRVRVGVIEAGEYIPDDAKINVPQGAGYLGNPDYDWMLSTTPQVGTNNRSIFLARQGFKHLFERVRVLFCYLGERWSEVLAGSMQW